MDKKTFNFVLCAMLVLGSSFLYPEVDSFYLKALQEGKTSFHEGRYEEAIESFKIAQFGLFEEKEYLPELYLYYALSCFKLRKIEEAHTLIENLKTKLKIKDTEPLPRPARIADDVDLMLLKLGKTSNPPDKTTTIKPTSTSSGTMPGTVTKNRRRTKQNRVVKPVKKSPPPSTKTKKNVSAKPVSVEQRFAPLFRETLEMLREYNPADSSKQVEKNLKKLEKLNRRDARVFYLKGLVAFNQQKYKECIKLLEKIVKLMGPTYQEEIYYYLVRSYYFMKNYTRALVFYRQIQEPVYREKLTAFYRVVMEIRSASIQQLSGNFSSRGLKKLMGQFPGDQSLCAEILDAARKRNPKPDYIIQVIQQCEKKPEAYNEAFIQEATTYLKSLGKIDQAIKMIRNTKFYNKPAPQHVEILYQLGQLYLDKLELQKALALMKKVKGIQNNYKKTEYFIEKINFLINRSRRIP